MSFARTRILQGINVELRNGTRPSVQDEQSRKLVDMAALLVTRMIAADRVKAAADGQFMAALETALADVQLGGDLAASATRLRELGLRAALRDWGAVESTLGPTLTALISSGSAAAAELAATIMGLDYERRDRIERAMQAEAVAARAPVRSGHESFGDTDIAQLTAILRRMFPDDPGVEIRSADIVAGGFSKQTAFLSLARTISLPDRIVIRRDRGASALATTVVGEYELLRTLYGAGVAVARPLGLHVPAEGEGGQPFLVSARAAGRNIGDYWDAHEPSETFGRDLARQLARLHTLPVVLFPQVDGADVGTRDHVEAELRATHADWASLNLSEPVADAAFAWLYRHLDWSEGRRALVHRDIGCHNMLVDEGRLSAIVDWEIAWIGNPARDVAYVQEMVSQCIAWDEFVATYVAGGAEMPSAREMRFYQIWAETKNLVWTAFSGQIFFSGLSDDLTLGYSGVYNHDRLCHRLARRLSGCA